MHNDYNYYESPVVSHSDINSNTNINNNNNHANASPNPNNENNSNNASDGGQLAESDCAKWFRGFIPKTVADIKVFLSVIIEIALLLAYALWMNNGKGERIIPYIITSWLLILWNTLTWAIRFVHTFYQVLRT